MDPVRCPPARWMARDWQPKTFFHLQLFFGKLFFTFLKIILKDQDNTTASNLEHQEGTNTGYTM